jgi:hypothetical protein
MKLGVSYNVFDGEELLEGSIKQIRSEVDYISIVYQEISNFGDKCNEGLLPLLHDLISKKLIDEIYKYEPINTGGYKNELNKRNVGLELSRKNGCTHHMSIDTDEYYDTNQFKFLKDVVDSGDYDSSACQMITYYNSPLYRLEPKEEYFVSLIFKIRNNTQYCNTQFPVIVDPTRKMNTSRCKIFTRDEIEMHHMSYVRKDIQKKVNNSSAKTNFINNIATFVEYFKSWEFGKPALMLGLPTKEYSVVETDNKFNITI